MRAYRIMKKAVAKFGLNLTGKRILTEAANNAFLWTPIIAALGGAECVYAITATSRYASAEEVMRETKFHAERLGVANCIEISTCKHEEYIESADIITNLGFVRPIDGWMVERFKSDAVICLMWEPWEFRSTDIDLTACRRKGIMVLGTNEQDPQLQTSRYVAMTVVKLLLENNVEIYDTNILLLGNGHFIQKTRSLIESMGARVVFSPEACSDMLDCIVCLEHESDICLIGNEGLVDLMAFPATPPLVIHVCGNIDIEHVCAAGAMLVPSYPASPGVMSFTTDHVGPKPVIDLHTAGLKVGQAWLDRDEEVLRALALPIPQMPMKNFLNRFLPMKNDFDE